MTKVIHNKLVRDNILEIIEKANKKPTSHILEEKEYIHELKNKLIEEANEVKESKDREELIKECADVLEVLEALLQVYDIKKEEVKEIQTQKARSNGKFDRRIYLEYVENK